MLITNKMWSIIVNISDTVGLRLQADFENKRPRYDLILSIVSHLWLCCFLIIIKKNMDLGVFERI